MKQTLFLLLSLLFAACGGENKNVDDDEQEHESNFLNVIPKIDSLYILELSEQAELPSVLTGKEVAFLSSKLSPLNVNGYFYQIIPEFLKIDSLKTNALYEDYLKKMDIGFLQNAEAYSLQKIAINSNFKAELWAIKYSSYEACPYFHGVDIFVSFYAQNMLQRTIQVGSNYAVVDPPMAFESHLWSEQNGNELIMTLKQKQIEMEENSDKTMEENNQTFTYDLINDRFID